MIDDQEFARPFARGQLQSELFAKCGNNGGVGRFTGATVRGRIPNVGARTKLG